MKYLSIVLLLSIFVMGCEESTYDPGSLGLNSNTGQTPSGGEEANNEEEEVVEPPVLTSLEETSLSVQQLAHALEVAYLENLGEAEVTAAHEDLDPLTQALVDALTNEGCVVDGVGYGIEVYGEEEDEDCPIYFYYYTFGGEFFEMGYEVYDEAILELNDISEFSLEGEAYDNIREMQVEIYSDSYGYLYGQLYGGYSYGESEFEGGFFSNLYFGEGEWGEGEYVEQLNQIGQGLFDVVAAMEEAFKSYFDFEFDF